jgi:hypothetical protein
MTQKDLKHRFDQLTLLKTGPAQSTAVEASGTNVVFPSTIHPAVFAALENADSTQINWKKLLKKDMARPRLEVMSNPDVMEIQNALSGLIADPVLVTVFSPTPESQNSLKQFSDYLKHAPLFWSSIVKDSCQLHLRFKGSKTQLWMRKNTVTAITLQDLRLNLDQEYRAGKNLKTYSTTRQDEWIELTLEISASSMNYHQKEISV